jgi:hypothetical protein
VLISSLYVTSLCAWFLRPLRVPSDQILGDDSHSLFPLIKNKNPLSCPFPHTIYIYLDYIRRTFVATPHTCDRVTTPLGTLVDKLCFFFFVWLSCLCVYLVCVFIFNMHFLFIICFDALILYIFVHALYRIASCITCLKFSSTHKLLS